MFRCCDVSQWHIQSAINRTHITKQTHNCSVRTSTRNTATKQFAAKIFTLICFRALSNLSNHCRNHISNSHYNNAANLQFETNFENLSRIQIKYIKCLSNFSIVHCYTKFSVHNILTNDKD